MPRNQMLTQFKIVFKNPSGTFQEGSTLSGEVVFTARESLMIGRLEIKFQGVSVVMWHKALEVSLPKSNISVSLSEDQFNDSEHYLNQKLNLLSLGKSQDAKIPIPIVLPGKHSYPFSIQLPDSLPPTFMGDYGFAKYLAKAEIDLYQADLLDTVDLYIPLSMSQVKKILAEFSDMRESNSLMCWKEFTMEKIVALTDNDKKPKHLILNKLQNIILLKVNDVRCTWGINKIGFLPGEEMHVHGDIENFGKIKILSSKVTLIQHIIYKTKKFGDNFIYQRKKLASKQKTGIRPEEKGFWRDNIAIPCDIPPTNESGLIDIRYSIKITIILVWPFKPMKSEMNIIIGSHREHEVLCPSASNSSTTRSCQPMDDPPFADQRNSPMGLIPSIDCNSFF